MDAKPIETETLSDVDLEKAALRVFVKSLAKSLVDELSHLWMKQLAEVIAEELAKRPPGHQETETPEGSGTCKTCMWRGPKICMRQGSPFLNKPVTDNDSCHLYKHTKIPRGPLFAQYSAKRQTRPRAVCDTCGCEFAVSKRGLYPHDVNGVAYVGGRGDKTRRCPGKPRTVGTT